jgi:hypothetical protein
LALAWEPAENVPRQALEDESVAQQQGDADMKTILRLENMGMSELLLFQTRWANTL